MAETQQEAGNEGSDSTTVTRGRASEEHQSQSSHRRPGQSREDRSLGTVDQQIQRRLKTIDSSTQQHAEDDADNQVMILSIRVQWHGCNSLLSEIRK